MKKIILIILLLISCDIFAQGSLYLGNDKVVTDSSNVLSMKKLVKMTAPETKFGSGGDVTFHLDLYNDAGKFTIERFNGDDLLVWDDDIDTWDFKFPISLNGVAYTTGGGDMVSTSRNHTTKLLTTDSLSVGKIISDLSFYSGAIRKIGTGDNYDFYIKRNGTDKIKVLNSEVQIVDGLNVGGNIVNIGGNASLYDVDITNNLNVSGTMSLLGDVDFGGATSVTLGTITSGTWNGSLLTGTYGGTGVNNGSKTITLGNNFTTSGNFALTLTQTNTTNVTLPTTGTLSTLAGTETFTNKTLTSPTLTTPTLGVATATTLNKLTFTTPATGSTLTILDGKTVTHNNTVTYAGTDGTTFTSGANSTTLTTTGTTNVTLPTTGTLSTLAGTETLTNKTLTSPTITGVTKGIISFASYIWSPADNNNYWFGGFFTQSPSTTEGRNKIYIPINCTITKVSISSIVTGTAATNDESTTYKIKRTGSVSSDTASYTISTAGKLTAANTVYNYAATVSIAITAGDYIEIKAETPNYNVNPTNVLQNGLIEIQ